MFLILQTPLMNGHGSMRPRQHAKISLVFNDLFKHLIFYFFLFKYKKMCTLKYTEQGTGYYFAFIRHLNLERRVIVHRKYTINSIRKNRHGHFNFLCVEDFYLLIHCFFSEDYSKFLVS